MKIYLVGGAVRDKLLNRTVKEHDYVVVGSTPDELISLGYQQVGNDFPVFLHPKTKDEYALARTERKSGQGYTGFICDFTPSVTLEEDLIRRDLTINAMAEDQDGNIIDPFNGQHDLNHKLIRHVSDAFSEDPLRILRVARFAARYHYLNFTIAPETLELMTKMVANGEINTLTKERIWLEIEKSLDDGAIHIFSNVLKQIGALEELIPYFQKNWTSETSQQLSALMSKVPESHKQTIGFCLWLRHLPLTECLKLADTLRVPNAYIDALTLFNTFTSGFEQANPNTHQVLEFFNRADIWRRPERFELFINTFKLLGERQASLAKQLSEAAKDATSVSAQAIIKQGYKGAEIKQQLDIARANAISALFQN